MPWVVRDVVHDINKAAGRRWQGLDSLLPDPGDLPEGCMAPLVASAQPGRAAGLGVCHHQHVPAGTLHQTWGTAGRFSLIPRWPAPRRGRRWPRARPGPGWPNGTDGPSACSTSSRLTSRAGSPA